MSQMTFAETEYAHKKRKTRREIFLERMDKLIPWEKLERDLKKYYPKGENGRPPYPLSSMLRVHCLQLFFNLSDGMMEDALYEIESMRVFSGLHLDRLPDETTILNFRHFLERYKLGQKIFDTINRHLAAQGLMLKEGTIIDASIISAPTSTKNESGERDPEMHSVKKGNQWYFGMKVHIGVDDTLGLIHSLKTTSAEVHDIAMADQLLHGDEQWVWGDAGYLGVEKRPEHEGRQVNWGISLRPGTRAQLPDDSPMVKAERMKTKVRSKVEHAFYTMKKQFGYGKVRYRGLAKNTNRLLVLAAFCNLQKASRWMAA